MARAYVPELLDESQKELVSFIKWCNKIYGYYPTIVGGWAVWAYAKHSKSIDIDLIMPTRQSTDSLLLPYYKARGFKEEGIFTKEYFKEIKTKEGKAKIVIDAASYSNINRLKEEKSIQIPWNLLEKNSKEYDFGGAKARIPVPELLLVFKVKALRDRTFEFKNAEKMVSGTPVIDPRMNFLESKIKKDKTDIKALLKLELDKNKLEQLLKKTKFKQLFEEAIKKLEAEMK